MDIDGCLTELGYGILWIAILAFVVSSLFWIFSAPDDICDKWDKIKVIEKTEQQKDILVEKNVCIEYKPSPLPSPFWRIWERI